MKRTPLLVLAAAVVLVVSFVLRPRGIDVEPRTVPPSGLTPRMAPTDLERPGPGNSDLIRGGKTPSHPMDEPPEGAPQLAPPPLDPSLVADDASPERSAWPLTKDGFQGAMAEVMPEVRECYEGWLAEQEDLAGKVLVELTISDVEGIGTVTEIGVPESTAGHAVFESCVTSVMREMEFDAPQDGGVLNVSWPFVFSTDEEQP